jgi:hypothetical protein
MRLKSIRPEVDKSWRVTDRMPKIKKKSPINDFKTKNKITETDMRTDDLEQYGRRHSLRISGIPESHKEHTDMLICEFLKNELNIEINMGNIDRSHRVGQKKPNLNRPIAVIIRFHVSFCNFVFELYYVLF